MITSSVYREGADVFRTFQDGLMVFMEKNNMQSMRDLQTRRPLYFESEEERAQYINALSARLDVNEQEPSDHAVHGDRWGHLVQLG